MAKRRIRSNVKHASKNSQGIWRLWLTCGHLVISLRKWRRVRCPTCRRERLEKALGHEMARDLGRVTVQ